MPIEASSNQFPDFKEIHREICAIQGAVHSIRYSRLNQSTETSESEASGSESDEEEVVPEKRIDFLKIKLGSYFY